MKKDFIGSASLDLYTMATGPVKHVVALTDASMRPRQLCDCGCTLAANADTSRPPLSDRFAGELELKVEFQQISAVSVHIDEVDLSGITSLGRIPTQLELVSMCMSPKHARTHTHTHTLMCSMTLHCCHATQPQSHRGMTRRVGCERLALSQQTNSSSTCQPLNSERRLMR